MPSKPTPGKTTRAHDGGALFVVATPIGNLGDLSTRAIEILRTVDVVAAEDTRRTRGLLAHIDAHPKVVSLHDHNEASRSSGIVSAIQAGAQWALVSDAGTPVVSDPGFRLVRAAHEAGVAVIPIPGPSAPLTLLSAAGIPCDRFFFMGFLSPKWGRARTALEEVATLRAAIMLFVSPYKLVKTVALLHEVFGKREAAIGCELTKMHERILRGTLDELVGMVGESKPRGEFVIMIAPPERSSTRAST